VQRCSHPISYERTEMAISAERDDLSTVCWWAETTINDFLMFSRRGDFEQNLTITIFNR